MNQLREIYQGQSHKKASCGRLFSIQYGSSKFISSFNQIKQLMQKTTDKIRCFNLIRNHSVGLFAILLVT